MKRILIPALLFLLIGCKSTSNSEYATAQQGSVKTTKDYESVEYSIPNLQNENDSVLLRIAFLGDAEPKPLAEFPHMAAAINQINTIAQTLPIDFVVGVGDIAHKGTVIQYEAATKVLNNLTIPFYPIMGNEEHGNSVETFMYYANKWNSKIVSPSYVLNHDKIAFVFASPDFSRDFDDNGATWILNQIQRLAPKPVVLIVHGAQKGVYPENRKKGIANRIFRKNVITQPNLAAVISGDLHMDMDRVNHSKKIKFIHYLHIPALERTKIPDETNHTAMFRMMTISKKGNVVFNTFKVGNMLPIQKHTYMFDISFKK
jgi:3',5'-cyclic-AMP phosphodiesterase